MAHAGYLPGPERRRLILEGAKRVFATRGYHDTNISHICDDLGIGRGTLYQYFKSKRDVFLAIIESLLERVQRVVDSEPPLVIPAGFTATREVALAHFGRCMKVTLEAAFSDEDSLRLLVREAVGLDVQIDSVLKAIDGIFIDRFTRDLALAQRAGVLKAELEPRAAALFVLGGIQKLALDVLSRDDTGRRIDIEALVRQATWMSLDGILADEVR
jgi:AcrR family transcriptional regulator